MTPAIALLKKHQVAHQVVTYQHDPQAISYGVEAAEKLGVPAVTIFKTLLVSNEKQELIVAIIPVLKQLDLKAVAQAVGVKKVSMAKPELAQKATGYLVGGISPLGQKKRLATFIDDSAAELTTMYVSGGRRGLDIALAPEDLAKLLNAPFVAIAKEQN